MSSLKSLFSKSPRIAKLRWLTVLVFVAVVLVLLHPKFSGSSVPASSPTTEYVNDSKYAVPEAHELLFVRELLKNHSIGPDIQLAHRKIRYVTDATERLQNTEIDQPLFPQSFQNITIDEEISLPSDRALEVHVKHSLRPDQVDASILLFAASTTAARFHDEVTSPIKEWTRWFTDGSGKTNGAGLVLALLNATDDELEHTTITLWDAGINATVIPSNTELDMAGRYVDLVQMLYNHASRNDRKYFALIDDDTFFPCINELIHVLSRYSPKRQYYMGTFTERTDWMLSNRLPMAYGGGGVFLTAPTARELINLPCLEKNEDGNYKLDADQGDRLLYNCIHKHTDIALTYLPRLRQLDQFGDPAGFYESGLQPLSLHHYKSWHRIQPELMHIVADACGEDCVLQKFQFSDNFVVTNGYSVAKYPEGIDFDPLQMEGTFGYGGDDTVLTEVVFSYSFGMPRKNLNKTGKKKSWELLGAIKESDGRVKQVYLKRKDDDKWIAPGEEQPSRDSVVVLTWIP